MAAEAGGDEARLLAERLVGPLHSATRLMLLEALGAAAAEISSELAPGSVEVRLRGRDPEFVVTSPTPDPDDDGEPEDGGTSRVAPASAPALNAAEGPLDGSDDGAMSRISLRLPSRSRPASRRRPSGRGCRSTPGWCARSARRSNRPSARRAQSPRRPSGGDRFTGWARA